MGGRLAAQIQRTMRKRPRKRHISVTLTIWSQHSQQPTGTGAGRGGVTPLLHTQRIHLFNPASFLRLLEVHIVLVVLLEPSTNFRAPSHGKSYIHQNYLDLRLFRYLFLLHRLCNTVQPVYLQPQHFARVLGIAPVASKIIFGTLTRSEWKVTRH